MRATHLIWIALLPADFTNAQVVFHDVGAKRGIGPYQNELGFASGIAAADYDNDGYVDVFVPQAAGVPDQLYRNRRDGTFEEIAADEKHETGFLVDFTSQFVIEGNAGNQHTIID